MLDRCAVSVPADLARQVLDHLMEGCQVISPDYRYLYVNDAVARQGKSAPDALLGRAMMEVYPGIEATPMFEHLRRCMEHGAAHHMENEFTFPDGSRGWFELRMARIPAGVVILSLDITQRKRHELELAQANEALAEAERRLDTTLQSIGDAVIATDAEGRVVRMNPVAEALTGWSLAEARGAPLSAVFTIVNEETGATVESPVDRVLREGRIVGLANHTLLINRDRSARPIADSGAPIRGSDGLIAGVVLVFRDQSEERRAEQALRASERYARSVLEAAPDAMVICDAEGRITSVNARVRDILGYEPAELLGSSIEVLIPPDLRAGHPARRAAYLAGPSTRPMGVSREVAAARKDGSRVDVEITLATIHTDGGPQVLSAIRDVSARKALEQQYQQAQKMESVGRLAGGVAHDFNNLLSVILSYSDMLMGSFSASDPLREDLSQIHRAGERAAALTRQLLAFSRKQVLQPRVVDLNLVVGGMDAFVARLIGEDIQLTMRLASGLHLVKVDPGQIDQVIMNLVVNARDAMPGGGRLLIETSNVDLVDEYAAGHIGVTPGPYAMVAVSDTGAGMTKEVQSRLFEPFFTTKERGKGTGLGLSTVFGIVKQSGGHVWVYSEPGKGSTFKIYFPRAAETEPSAGPRVTRPTSRGRETVLLVEDDPMVRGLAKTILERGGYRVFEAATAGEAVLLCERHADELALLLTDVVMPLMSGRELAERLMAICPRVRVLFMSGYTENAIVHHGVLDPGIDFIQKPLTPEELLSRVREVLDRQP